MVNISIKGTHMELTPAIRSYVEEKVGMVEKLIDKNDTDAFAQVEVGQTTMHHQSGSIFRAEINLKTSRASFRATADKEDLYDAIDTAKDELMNEMRKHKDKHETMIRKGGRMFKSVMRRMGFGE